MIGEQPDGTLRVERMEAEKPKKMHLSNSQMYLLTQCGEAYRKRYIEKVRSKVTVAMIVGGAVDETVNANMLHKIKTGALLSWQQIEQKTRDAYTIRIAESLKEEGILFKQAELIDGERETIAEGLAKAARMSKLHYDSVAPKLNPLYVQRPLFVELPDWPFDIGGIIDLEETDGTIRDTKVKDKTPSQGFADDDDQLTLYAMLEYLTSGALPKLVYDCLIDTKSIKYVPLETTRAVEDFDVMLRRIQVCCEGITKGVFLPARETDWWCGKYACSYWGGCKYVKRSKRPNS
jgi:PD-(D/E)XK nuclease superfamily